MEDTPSTTTTSTGTPLNPKDVLEKILDGLALQGTVEQDMVDGNVLLHITTPDPGRLIGRRGQTLSQLQFLVNRILLRASQDAPRVTIDCENYRGKLRDDVSQQALEAADKVRRWGEPVVIGPYNAFDRRAIHQQFKDDPEIEVLSEDDQDGGMKKMTLKIKQ